MEKDIQKKIKRSISNCLKLFKRIRKNGINAVVGNKYAIPIEKDFREDVSVMCNLSQKIKETGIEIGKEAGIEIGKREMILSMHRKGYTTAQIADVAGITEKQVEDIIKLELQLV